MLGCRDGGGPVLVLSPQAQSDGLLDPVECKGKLEFEKVCFTYATRHLDYLGTFQRWTQLDPVKTKIVLLQ